MSGRVLIVDDDPAIRDSMAEILADEGYSVAQAANGSEALEQLRAGPGRPDLILLDLMMPVMNGFELLDEQARDPALAHIPVVVLSADGRASERASRLPATTEVIRKPFRLAELVRTVRRICP